MVEWDDDDEGDLMVVSEHFFYGGETHFESGKVGS